MFEEDNIQQQPTGGEATSAGIPGEDVGSGQATEQPTFKRVTPEEAATLDYAELKRRMREERRLYEEGLLPEASATSQTGDEDEDTTGGTAGTAGQEDSGNQGSGGRETGGTGQQAGQSSDLERLAREARERETALRAENHRLQEEQRQRELQARHQRVEAEIASLPQQQQAIARQAYMNQLGQAALNDYYGYLNQREQAIRQAELGQARVQLPGLLSELAESVAQRHGVKSDRLKEYVTSDQFRELLNNAPTEEALTVAAANAGQWMEFLAVQEVNRLASEREQRRQRAAANPKVQRDTPAGGVPTAGGELDIVRRINSMSKEEFFEYKKQKLREAAGR